ncbi:MAG: hypothetical protein LV477_05145 [Candidatus Nitrosotalea sp.]|nr:hypothetical protein [Candidatus Nitrosotalea sp.]
MDHEIVKSNVSINSKLKFSAWLKNDAEWFDEGKISNDKYSNALGYILESNLVNELILKYDIFRRCYNE